jgi:hypothetical protein
MCDRLPLWLEEGLATLMGMNITRQYYSRQGRPLTGSWPAVAGGGVAGAGRSLLTARPDYPPSPGAAQAFGRQAAEVTCRMLRERVGLGSLAHGRAVEIGQRGDWRSVLASGYGVDMRERYNRWPMMAAGPLRLRVWNY